MSRDLSSANSDCHRRTRQFTLQNLGSQDIPSWSSDLKLSTAMLENNKNLRLVLAGVCSHLRTLCAILSQVFVDFILTNRALFRLVCSFIYQYCSKIASIMAQKSVFLLQLGHYLYYSLALSSTHSLSSWSSGYTCISKRLGRMHRAGSSRDYSSSPFATRKQHLCRTWTRCYLGHCQPRWCGHRLRPHLEL